MRTYVLKRLFWMVPTLIGISFVTFLLMELAPGSQALVATEQSSSISPGSERDRAKKVQLLMKLHGLLDEDTGEELPMLVRYGKWLRNAVVFEFAGVAADDRLFRKRIRDALPVTILLNALALLLAFGLAIPLGAHAGMRLGGVLDRATSTLAFAIYGIPEFLIATLLLMVLGGGFFDPVLPALGLASPGAAQFGFWERLTDLTLHLVMPVTALAAGYGVVVFRFLRESVARSARSDFALALRGFGLPESVVRRRVLRNGLSPVVTILGTMLPALVSGTVVVESVFGLPGLGWLTMQAVNAREMAMVMALTMLVSVVTLLSLILSDVLQRVVDPRVELR